jgi:hypothetical protein
MQWLLPLSTASLVNCYVCQQRCLLRLSTAVLSTISSVNSSELPPLSTALAATSINCSVVNSHVCQQQCYQLRCLSAAASICCICQLLRLSTAVLSTATSVSSVVYYVCQQRVVNCHVSALWSTATSVNSSVVNCHVCQPCHQRRTPCH